MKSLVTTVLIVLSLNLLFAGTDIGSVKWSFTAGDKIKTCPAIDDDGTIYVTSHDGNLYALNSDGSLKWKFQAFFNGGDSRTWINNSPVIGPDGTIYIVEDYGTVYAVNPDNTEKWHVDVTTGVVDATPSLAPDGSLVILSSLETVVLDVSDGSIKWKMNKAYNSIDSSPAIDGNGTILAGGALRSFTKDGVLNWSAKKGSLQSSPAIDADGAIYIASRDQNLYAYNSDGSVKWAHYFDKQLTTSPVIGADGTIYVFAPNKLYAINPDGTEKWAGTDEFNMTDLFSTPVIGADGIIYIFGVTSSWEAKLLAINPDGTDEWSAPLDDIPYSFVTITNDSLLLISVSDVLYAIKTTSKGIADSPWPKFKKDLKNTGYTATIVSEIENVEGVVPQKYSISNAYPNPFNPTTSFSFTIPKSSQVNISVYNALGQLVDNLINDTKSSGTYEVTWDASSFGSGVYFIKINAGSNFTETRKVILLK